MVFKSIRRAVKWIVLASATAGVWAASQSSQEPLPFLGNATILGAVSGSQAMLFRETDCSISELTFYPDHIPTFHSNYQDTLHRLGGMTTTGNVYPKGCAEPLFGTASSSIAFLGKGSDGKYRGVQAARRGNDLVLYVADAATLTYQSVTLATNVFPAVVVADLNNDGLPDIIAAGVTDATTHTTGLGVFLSKSDHSFNAPTVYATGPGGTFLVDDLNGDGKPDILAISPGAGTQLSVLLGRGDGTFSTGTPVPVGAVQTLTTADIDGDGKRDILTSDGKLYRGVGDGTFAAGTQALPASLYNVAAFAAADFDADGHVDIAVLLANTGGVTLYKGDGAGHFTLGPTYASTSNAASMVATDIDGDGNPDLVVGRASGGAFGPGGDEYYLQILLGRGDGTLSGAPVTPNTSVGAGGAGVYALDQVPSANWVALADFTGDAKPDLIAPAPGSPSAPPPTGLAVYPGAAGGAFDAAALSATHFPVSVVTALDVDGDGKQDAVVAGYNGSTVTVATLLGAGDGHFSGEVDYPLPANSGVPTSLATGDFNGDHIQDIAVALIGGSICSNSCTAGTYVLLGKSDHSFAAPVRIDSSTRPVIAAGDLNGDGRDDLLIADSGSFGATPTPGRLQIYAGNADGSFTATDITPGAYFWSSLHLADLDEDGKLDLIAGVSTGPGSPDLVMVGQTAAAATASKTKASNQASTDFPHYNITFEGLVFGIDPLPTLAVGDFDGDGHLDVAYFIPGGVSGLLYGTGSGSFPRQTHFGIGTANAGTAIAADLTGHGKTDLVVADRNLGGIVSVVNQTGELGPSLASTTTSLTATPNPVNAGASLTLTATVTTAASGTPTGSVDFLDGSTVLQTVAVSAQGIATLSLSTLSAGSHSLSAQYAGDAGFAASTSSAVAITVNAAGGGDFTIASSSTALTLTAGQSAQATLTLTPTGGFTGTTTFACGGLPAHATCSFSPSSLDLSAGSGTSTLTIATSVATASATSAPTSLPNSLQLLFASMWLPVAAGRSLRRSRSRGLIVLAVAGFALAACGGGHGGSAAPIVTPPGTYAVTVTATSGSLSHAVTVALTVS